jgi:hypothetical protein
MPFNANWLAILIAAVAAWMFGAAYYGLLAKHWVAALGRTMEDFKAEQAAKTGTFSGMAPFFLSFAAELVMAFVLSGIIIHVGIFTLRAGIISGALCWLGFVLTTISVNYAYSGRRPMLTIIDAAHWLGALVLMGAIIGWMGR